MPPMLVSRVRPNQSRPNTSVLSQGSCPVPPVPRSCPVPACRGSFASLSEKGSPPPAGILFVPAGDPCPHRPDSNHSRPATHPCEVSGPDWVRRRARSEEHTSELQSHVNLVCRLL